MKYHLTDILIINKGGKEMDYYMLRMMNHDRKLMPMLFEDNYVGIGYEDFDRVCNWNYIEKYNNEPDKEKLLTEMINLAGWNCNGRQRAAHRKLNKFFQFKQGDILLVPDSGVFHMVEIISDVISFNSIRDKYVGKEEDTDIGFLYKVRKIKNNKGESAISRKEYAGARLTARLKNISGLLNINDLKEEIEGSRQAFLSNQTINLNEVIKEKLKVQVIEEVVKTLNPNKFEHFIVKVMDKLGATTTDIPAKNNKENTEIGIGDVDVVAVFEKLKHIIYIQAKFHEGETSTWALEQLNDYHDKEKEEDGYTQAYWAITTGKFSKEAEKLSNSEESKNIRLIDRDELAEMILDIGVEGI